LSCGYVCLLRSPHVGDRLRRFPRVQIEFAHGVAQPGDLLFSVDEKKPGDTHGHQSRSGR
jgi:hypothetical protein